MTTHDTVVVTGATGHVGNVLVRELLDRGVPVCAMVLPGEDLTPLAGLDVECVEGDVRDLDALRRAFAGASTVYHLAGLISILPGQTEALHAVNVLGTRNVVSACEECGVARMVYVSSVHALVEPPHGVAITEAAGFDPSRLAGPYAQSKARATQEVMRGVERGLNAVVVFPSGVVGPYDFNVSEMGQIVLHSVQHRRLPAYVDGAYDFVDVRDVVNGIMAAGQKGRKGEGYILCGELLSISRLMALLQELTGVPAPVLKLPQWIARTAAVFTPLLAIATGTKPRFTSYSLRVLRSNALMDCSKARRELGYTARPLNASFADAVEWFRASGL
ncbi:MAG: SDR family oxidoreductase [Candidatus Hydrogenedentes bacterium]|nr:SDR family oxidoreductase [Candidatus Hydrogenedentota bacterium]